ncbi:lipid phosphate phosphatase 1 [Moniliophthora roreri]|nr:lipid phosphate phosphatase 1 [Moniliophthora roreri]
MDANVDRNATSAHEVPMIAPATTSYQLWTVHTAPDINVAPRMGQKNKIIFQYAGLWALITLSCALK